MFRASHSSRSCRGGMLNFNCLTADACFTGSFHFRLPVALPQTTMEVQKGSCKDCCPGHKGLHKFTSFVGGYVGCRMQSLGRVDWRSYAFFLVGLKSGQAVSTVLTLSYFIIGSIV